MNGMKIPFIDPTIEKNNNWTVTSNMIAGKCIESFRLYKDINHYIKNTNDIAIQNPALELLYNRKVRDKKFDDMFKPYFCNKTQGNDPHMILLSIACVITNDFPEAAIVHGDITHAQCVNACELASKVLVRDIHLPLQYDFERLYVALINEGYTDYDLFKRFYSIYSGWSDKKYIVFIQDKFPEEYFIRYYSEKINSWPLDIVAKEWLERELSLDGLFEVYKSLYSGNSALQTLIEIMITGQVHIKEKTVYDFTERSEYNEIPDDVSMLFARFMAKLTGYSRYIIDAFIPLKELKAKFISAFPSYDVRGMFDKALSNSENTKVEELYNQVFDLSDKLEKKAYDISDLRYMFLWDKSKTVEPMLWNKMLDIVRTADEFGKEAISGALKKPENRLAYICKNLAKYYALPENLAEKILTNYTDDAYIAKYIGLLSMPFDELDTHKMCYVLMMNERLLDRLIEEVKG